MEYKWKNIVIHGWNADLEGLTDQLNALADEGWRVHTLLKSHNGFEVLLERNKTRLSAQLQQLAEAEIAQMPEQPARYILPPKAKKPSLLDKLRKK
jgi:hypothetical protein